MALTLKSPTNREHCVLKDRLSIILNLQASSGGKDWGRLLSVQATECALPRLLTREYYKEALSREYHSREEPMVDA